MNNSQVNDSLSEDIDSDTSQMYATQQPIIHHPAHSPYRKEDRDYCTKLFQQGMSVQKIYAATSISKSTIYYWNRMNCKKGKMLPTKSMISPYNKEDRDRCIKLFQQGMSVRKIYEATSIPKRTLYYWNRKNCKIAKNKKNNS